MCKYSLEMRQTEGRKGRGRKRKGLRREGEKEKREREKDRSYTHVDAHNCSPYTCYDCVFYMLCTCKQQVEHKYV